MNRLLALFVSSLLLASCAGKTNTYELIPYPNELTPRSGTYAVAGAAFTCDERLDEAGGRKRRVHDILPDVWIDA